MSTPDRPQVIALEEHYFDAELSGLFEGVEAQPKMGKRLLDMDDERIRLMDEAGVDIQVLSHAAPGTHRLDAATAVPIARRVNDRLKEIIDRHPTRFAGFATLPAADPQAAADELERAVSERSGMQVVRAIGGRAVLHLTSSGKLFLAADDARAVRSYSMRTGLAGQTRNSITDVQRLERELEEVRRQGFARDNEELELGVRCIAAAIRDDGGRIVAGLSISAPSAAGVPGV